MIITRFNSEDLQHITCAADFYEMVGVIDYVQKEMAVTGRRAYYANMFIAPATRQNVLDAMHENVDALVGEYGTTDKAKIAQDRDWDIFAPLSVGPRYKEFERQVGYLMTNTIYILQPGDRMYKESPRG